MISFFPADSTPKYFADISECCDKDLGGSGEDDGADDFSLASSAGHKTLETHLDCCRVDDHGNEDPLFLAMGMDLGWVIVYPPLNRDEK